MARVCGYKDRYVNGMADLARVTINWTGFVGAPGYTNLYFRNATPGTIDQAVVDNAIVKVDAFIAATVLRTPTTVTRAIDPSIEIIDDTNGELQSFMTGTIPSPRVGTGTGAYSAPSGAVISWYTNTVRNGRRIRGRTFHVPIAAGAMDTDGTIQTAALTDLRTAADNLRAASGASRLVIWGRPTTPGGTDGVSAEVTASQVPDMAAVLTSRRD